MELMYKLDVFRIYFVLECWFLFLDLVGTVHRVGNLILSMLIVRDIM